MNLDLNSNELRILGSLIEKEITTPEYYPLSLNALLAACNQKSNREPVMNLDETDASIAIESLREKKLVWQLSTAAGRVPKFEHNMRSLFSFSKQETAILCVLMLRGAQTAGELKGRTERMYPFQSLEEVDECLKNLKVRDDGPYVIELPRQPGQKEPRFMHTFSSEMLQAAENSKPMTSESAGVKTSADRLLIVEQELNQLKEQFDKLRNEFNDLKKMLE